MFNGNSELLKKTLYYTDASKITNVLLLCLLTYTATLSFYIKWKKKKKKEILDNTDILRCEFKSALQKVRPKDSAY